MENVVKPVPYKAFKAFIEVYGRGARIALELYAISEAAAYRRVAENSESWQTFKFVVKTTAFLSSYCMQGIEIKSSHATRDRWNERIFTAVAKWRKTGLKYCPKWKDMHKYLPAPKKALQDFYARTYPQFKEPSN